MYQFKIKEQDSGGYRFELGQINILIEGFTIKDGKHLLSNPNKAIAYFSIEDNIYGISNDPNSLPTVEALYDAIYQQYKIFTRKKLNAA
jgi:hypothetical protein